MVTTADYQIGEEAAPIAQTTRQRSAAANQPQIKRQLVSLYGGESGDSVPERGYMTDVVWGEQTSTDAMAAAGSPAAAKGRIVYYSFNVGQWRRKLNIETSVLTRAFMTQPVLMLLPDQDKAAIAAQLVTTPLFKQAKARYRAQILDPLTNTALLDEFIEAVGEQGVAQMTAPQKQSSGQALYAQLKAQRASIMTAATTVLPSISFAPAGAPFPIFQGMSVNGSGTTTDPVLDFKSNSSLYYGIQELAKFKDTDGDFGANLDKHFFKAQLIKPVNGLFNPNSLNNGQATPFNLSAINNALMTPSSIPVNLAIFRNNPNTYVDAPMVMNMVTLAAITIKAGIGISDLFQHDKINKVLEKVRDINKAAEPYKKAIALSYSVAKSIQDLVCTATEAKNAWCDDYADKIDRVVALIPTDVMKTVEATIKAGDGGREAFDSGTFCSGLVAEQFSTYVGKSIRKKTLADNNSSSWYKVKVCMVDEIFTKKLVAKIKSQHNELYQKLEDAGYDRNTITLTANYFARHYQVQTKGVDIKPKFYLESLISQLLSKEADLGNLFSVSNAIMDMNTKALKFWQAGGKVDLMPFLKQTAEAYIDYIKNDYVSTLDDMAKEKLMQAFYDAFKALTPAKFVQLAATANEAGGFVWDWVTDPNVVKLNMTRNGANSLAISTAIPHMEAVRYLKIPVEDPTAFPIKPSLVLDYSKGLTDAGNMPATTPTDKLLVVSPNPDSNHLLVYSGFKASVENQTAFKGDEDKGTIQKLLEERKVHVVWHVKKFSHSDDVATLLLAQRNEANAFINTTTKLPNYFSFDAWKDNLNNWFWGLSPVSNLDASNPVHASKFKDSQGNPTLGNYQAIDFTRVYKTRVKAISLNPFKKPQDYPLTHKTAGIYSDYTHVQFKSGGDEKLYQNTFNLYVLPKLNAVAVPNSPTNQTLDLDAALNTASRLYCEESTCTQNGELQLNFANYAVWDQIGQNGLWAVWMQADGTMDSEPVAVRHGSGGTITSTLRVPKNTNINTGYLIIYEDVMKAYLQHSGKSKLTVLQAAFTQRIRKNNRRYPVIALSLADLYNNPANRTDIPLLKPLDTDKDGVPDNQDAFPNDPNYAYDTDTDQMPDEWERLYSLNLFVDDSKGDLDGDGISNLDEFKAKTDPLNLAVTVTLGDKQVKLAWKQPLDTQTQSVCWSEKKIIDAGNCVAINNAPTNWLENQTSPVTIKALTNGTSYYFSVLAENLTNGKTIASKVLTAIPQKPFTINDTGITTCSDNSQNGLACPVTGFPGQDAEAGRDVSQNDNSNGHAGFNFVKISATGAELPATATSWNCVKDKVTGLMWEVKTDDGGLHDKDWTYSWYEPDANKNGGWAGRQNGGSCVDSGCDTDAYTQAVNTAGWCGFKDWRMPTVDELSDIASLDRYNPAIDTAYFPNTQSRGTGLYWSSSPYANDSDFAWSVFKDGSVGWGFRYYSYYVRLVRSGQ